MAAAAFEAAPGSPPRNAAESTDSRRNAAVTSAKPRGRERRVPSLRRGRRPRRPDVRHAGREGQQVLASVDGASSNASSTASRSADGRQGARPRSPGKPDIFIAGADVNEIATADAGSDPEMIRGRAPHLREAREPAVPDRRRDRRRVRGRGLRDGPRDGLAARVRLAEDADRPAGDQARDPAGLGRDDAPAAGDRPRGRARRHPRRQGRSTRGARRRMGLVDEVVPAAILDEVAKGWARRKIRDEEALERGVPAAGPVRVKEAGLAERLLEGSGEGSRLLEGARVRDEGDARATIRRRSRPSPRREGLRRAVPEGARVEAEGIGTPRRHADDAEPRRPLLPDGGGQEGDGSRGARRRRREAAEDRACRRPRRRRHGRRHRPARGRQGSPRADEGHQARSARARLRAGRPDLEGEAQEAAHDARRIRGEDGAPRRLARLRRVRDVRRHDRGRPREDGGQARRPGGVGEGRPARRRSSRRTPRRSRSRRSPRTRRTPSASSACTSSTRSTRCRSSRSSTARGPTRKSRRRFSTSRRRWGRRRSS